MPVGTLTGVATRFDWSVDQGELVQLLIPVLDDNDQPFTVTGWSVDAKIKTAPRGTILSTWASQDVIVAGSSVTLSILPATSLGWTFTKGWYRVKIVHPTDATQIYRILDGYLTVNGD